MTATFGKLNHETLTLQPGLNIIEAPNEWGKSTWCAFLVNMLYGIDTKARVGGTTLVDKEHYAPWSGAPMSGRIELNWNGRDITIERSTKGRVIFGNFRAFETQTGIEVPELNATNCGQMLLGVERPVFSRAGFIRLQDLPVTQDDSLRRRLNNLVTTGDENSAGDRLGAKLRELKNKCRSNRANGLIPQAEYERDQLREQLQELQELQTQTVLLQEKQARQEQEILDLENHMTALRYEAAKQGQQRIAAAEADCQRLQTEREALESQCARLPSLQTAEEADEKGRQLQSRHVALLQEEKQLPQPPQQPQIPELYRDMTPEQAVEKAKADYARQAELEQKRKKQANSIWFYVAGATLVLAAMAIAWLLLQIKTPLVFLIGGGLIVAAGIVYFLFSARSAKRIRAMLLDIYDDHPGISPENWVSHAEAFRADQTRYAEALAAHRTVSAAFTARRAALDEEIAAYAGQDTIENSRKKWDAIAQQHLALAAKGKELRQAQQHANALQAVAGEAEPPEFPDALTLSESETERMLTNTRAEYRLTHVKLGQCIGQAQTLGAESTLRARLDTVSRRLARLEETYEALSLAQDALYQATTSLQRRFAPRISKRAQALFSRLTEGRYQRITLGDDLSMSASAEDEDTLRSAQWRSDGTVDQLYLALRLAVAGELTPDAPLVLDDALVRFDDKRLQVALELLQEEAEQKQVLLFTCQARENKLLQK